MALAVASVGLMLAHGALAQITDVPIVTESEKLVPSDSDDQFYFGSRVATTGDEALVANPHDGYIGDVRSGTVYNFVRSSGNDWTEIAEIEPSDPTDYMAFGGALAMDGRFAIIGAKASAYVFERTATGAWIERAKLTGDSADVRSFGYAVAISGDTAVVSGSDVSGSKLVYVFTRQGDLWLLAQVLDPGPERPQFFGSAVALRDDVLAVRADLEPDSGVYYVAYVYRRLPSGLWSLSDRLTSPTALPDSDAGLGLDTDGNRIVIGAPGDDTRGQSAGAVYIFRREGPDSWTEEVKLLPPYKGTGLPGEAQFGWQVAIEDDVAVIVEDQGGRLLSGDAFVYRLDNAGIWEPIAFLYPSDPIPGSYFGDSVDLSKGTVIVGSGELGGGYVYETKSFEPIFNPNSGSYFQLIYAPEGINWYEARGAAEVRPFQGMTGHLATYASAEEEEFVIEAFPLIEPNYVWLGASDEASERDWQWITGEPWNYVNWGRGEPNGGTDENCLDYGDGATDWNDEWCARRIGFYLVEFSSTIQSIAIDVKPGNRRNVVNPSSKGRFWVAVLSDSEFDALQVDPATVAFGKGEASPDRYRVKDANRDRLPDLMLRFRTPEVGLQCGDTEVELTGETYAGDSIIGSDSVKTVGCEKPKKRKKK
jgi:hypothetical protein